MKKLISKTTWYWVTTLFLCFGMLSGGIAQLLRAEWNTAGIQHLGYPVYVMTILGSWKIAGVFILFIPGFRIVKEWAYAGFFFLMSGAILSHLASGDGIGGVVWQGSFLLFIVTSWYLRPADRKVITH